MVKVMRSQLQLQCSQIARALDSDLCRKIPFSETDRTNAAYISVREQMTAYGGTFGHRGIYSVALRDGRLVIGPEDYAVGDPSASPPGTANLQPEVRRIITHHSEHAAGTAVHRKESDMSLEHVLREMGEIAGTVTVIGLFTGESPAEIETFRAAGVKAYLAKPFTLWQLRDAIIEAKAIVRSAGGNGNK